MDNAIEYTYENCVSCCNVCNLAKRNMNYNDFIAWGLWLSEHLKRKVIQ